MEPRCSLKHLNEYKNAINTYLKSKGISDFSKYDVYLKNDGEIFRKWDYPGILKPVNIQPLSQPMKSLDLQTRLVVVNVKAIFDDVTRGKHGETFREAASKSIYLNVNGDIVEETYVDPHYYIDFVLHLVAEAVNKKWHWIQVTDTFASNGLIKISHIGNIKNAAFQTGNVRITFLFADKKDR